MNRKLLILLMCAGLLAPLGQADGAWLGRFWASWPSIDFFMVGHVPGGRATNETNPDIATEVGRMMDGLWQYAVSDFTVPDYFEPFTETPELYGTNFPKFAMDYKEDAKDFSRAHFEVGDGLSPKLYRQEPPVIQQDGTRFVLNDAHWTLFASRKDQVVSGLTADLMIPLSVAYAGGLIERRRLFAWQSPGQDNMLILMRSYGRPDPLWVPDQRVGARGAAPDPGGSNINANPVLQGLHIGQNFLFLRGSGQGPAGEVRNEGDVEGGSRHLRANLGALGRWDELYSYEEAADHRLFYARDGDSGVDAGYRADEDDRGEPAPPAGHEALTQASEARIGPGEFLESEYKAKAWLYVSQNPTTFEDYSDANNWLVNDPVTSETAQPRMMKVVPADNWFSTDGFTRAETYDFIVDPGTTRDQRIHQSDVDEITEVLDHAEQVTWGPWDLAAGEWVHTVEAWIVAGPSWEENKRVGALWSTGGITFAEKEEFLNSGEDSMRAEVALAQEAWANRAVVAGNVVGNQEQWPIGTVPSLPLSLGWPSSVTYNSGPEQNDLSWNAVAGAASYNVYRMVGDETNLPDPPNIPAPTGGSGLLANQAGTTYTDTDVIRGERYYYAITSLDAGGQESSLFATRGGSTGISPFSAPTNDLTRIRVVPNPFSILGGDLTAGGTSFTAQPHKLLFVNLPPRCIIRIFTLNGDLVTRIDHTSGSGDEEWAFMDSDNNQFIVSGVYVAHFTDPDSGKTDIEKFVVVR